MSLITVASCSERLQSAHESSIPAWSNRVVSTPTSHSQANYFLLFVFCVESRSRCSTVFPGWIIMVCLLCWGSLETCPWFSAAREGDQRVIRFFFTHIYSCLLKWNRLLVFHFHPFPTFMNKNTFAAFSVNWTQEIRDENVLHHWCGQ